MSRTREEILNTVAFAEGYIDGADMICNHGAIDKVYDAMDEYFTERALELLEYMAEKKVICHSDEQGAYFNTRGETLTKEQLFENFL